MFPFADTIPTHRWAFVTYAIIAVNVWALLWLQSLPDNRQQEVVAQRGFVAARIGQLRDSRVIVNVPVQVRVVDPFGRFALAEGKLQLPANRSAILLSTVTCMFLHGGWMHLIGNMWFLLIFGNNVEDRLGHFMFAVFYLLGGWAATALQWAIDPNSVVPMIGASGAVAAILGAYSVTFHHARVKTLIFLFIFVTVVELPALLFMGLWFGMQLLSGLRVIHGPMEGVAWWAHVGGFLAGMFLMRALCSIIPETTPQAIDGPADGFGTGWPRRFDNQD